MFWGNGIAFCKALTVKQTKKVIKNNFMCCTFFALQYLFKDNLHTLKCILSVGFDEFGSTYASM